MPSARGTARAVAVGVLATAALVVAHMVPGVLGILSRWSALAAALLMLGLVYALAGRAVAPAPVAPDADELPESAVSWVIAGGSAAAVALWLLARAWTRTVLPQDDIDTLTIHFPVVGKWVQGGSMWPVDQFVPLLAHGNYPHTGDVVFLATILPWRNDWLTGAVNPVFIALAAAAVYAIARELGTPRPAAVMSGTLFAAVPVVIAGANGGGMTDSIMFATFAAGLLFLLRFERGAPRGELWLAALALGLAFGTKWYGVWAVAAVVGVWFVARLVRRAPFLRDTAVLGGLIALVGGFWLLRNAIESGSPIYPSSLGPFETPFDPLRACGDFTVADYFGDGDAWSDYILPAYRQAYLWAGAAIGAGLVAAVVLAIRMRDGAVLAFGALSVLLAIGYAVTPTSAAGPEGDPALVGANTRYLVPAIIAAAPLAGLALGRAGRLRLPLELAGAGAVVYTLAKWLDVPLHVVLGVLAILVAISGAAWLALYLSRRLPHRPRVTALASAIALAAGLLIGIGHARQREFNRDRYATGEATQAWIAEHAPKGHRIALAGVWGTEVRSPVWPAFGERIRNEVDYLGQTVDGQLREYASRRRWAAALSDGDYDLVLVGRGGYVDECPVQGELSEDDRWAREEGFTQLARSAHLTIYRIH